MTITVIALIVAVRSGSRVAQSRVVVAKRRQDASSHTVHSHGPFKRRSRSRSIVMEI